MNTLVLGCDPGLYGALVALYPDGTMEYESMPLVMQLTKHKIVDAIRVGEFVDQLSHMNIVFVIEKVGAMPAQGVSSTFKFGYGTGIVTGAVVSRAAGNGSLLSSHAVTPQAWKKHFDLIKKPKEAAVELMKEYLPDTDFTGITKQRISGIADAYLIAKYGMHLFLE